MIVPKQLDEIQRLCLIRTLHPVILRDLESDEESCSADVSNGVRMQLLDFPESVKQLLSNGAAVFLQMFLFNIMQHGLRCGDGDRVSAKGVEVRKLITERGKNLVLCCQG